MTNTKYVIAPYIKGLAMYEPDDFRLKEKRPEDIKQGTYSKTNSLNRVFNGHEIGIFNANDGTKYVIFTDHSVKQLDDDIIRALSIEGVLESNDGVQNNYKDLLLNFVIEGKTDLIETYKEEGLSTEAIEKAYDLTLTILTTRFNNELKQYNNDEQRAFDVFIAKKNLDYLRIFIEEFLLLDKEESQIEFYKAVRKHMRELLNNLYMECL